MPPRSTAASAAAVFAALGDATRLRLVSQLSERGPQSIARLTEGGAMTRQAITKHLRVLSGAGVLRSSREGRETIWELEPRRLAEAQRHLDTISRRWDAAIDRLRALVEGDDGG
jgi:DNA-binding transcriptional ArsR family regulator